MINKIFDAYHPYFVNLLWTIRVANLYKVGNPITFYGFFFDCVGFAVCCKYSFVNGMDGSIFFDAKNRLMPYYIRMGATHIYGLRMAIEYPASKKPMELYF